MRRVVLGMDGKNARFPMRVECELDNLMLFNVQVISFGSNGSWAFHLIRVEGLFIIVRDVGEVRINNLYSKSSTHVIN